MDATASPITSNLVSIVNAGSLGGYFSTFLNTTSISAVGPLSTPGITFSGNGAWMELTLTPGGTLMATPLSITGNGPASIEAWVYCPALLDVNMMVGWGTRATTGASVVRVCSLFVLVSILLSSNLSLSLNQ